MSSTTTARWSGQWIAPGPRAVPGVLETLHGGPPPQPFSRSLFRRTVELGAVPAEAPVRITADSRYVLWVNGREVGRGPARSQPYRQRYDSYDLAPHLVEGTNVLAVLVTWYGEATSFWQPAAAGASPDAVLVLEARLGDDELVSDDAWRVSRSAAWSQPADDGGGLGGVPVEICDARQLPHGWQEAGFDDSAWAPATPVAAGHQGALAQTRPPTYPFGRLLPRGMSHQIGDLVSPVRVLDCSARPVPAAWPSDHPVQRARETMLAGALETFPAELPATVVVGPGRAAHLAVDFGRIVAGFVELDLSAPAGTAVELYYREKPFRADLEGSVQSDPATGARFVTRGGEDSFRAIELNGLRYVHLVVHAEQEAAVTVSRLAVREHLYPRTGGAYFRSEDPLLDRLYRAGVRTVQLNSLDSYTDCPTREQRAWVGDGVVHQMVDLVTNEDWGLARNFLELGDSPRPDGILPMVVVGEVEARGGVTIPDWSLSWTHGVHVQYCHDGDLDRVRRHLPTFERVLRWYTSYLDERGTIADVPEWNLVDWSSLFLDGRSSILTALWARSLAEYAELSEAAGNAGSAAWARDLHAAAARGFEDFWDAGRGVYVDSIQDGERRPAASQAAQAAAIVSGLAPRERWSPLVDVMTDPGRLVVRSWIGNHETGGYDFAKMADEARGVRRLDWDPEREMVLAEPFFSYAVHDAVARAGRAELLVDLVRRWETLLGEDYDTFGECWGWGTPVHGWSSTPARDLISYVLGVTPDRPGYERVRVAPRPGRLHELAGAVPTPHGPVEVRISGTQADIDSPVPVLVVRADGTEEELPAGRHRVAVR